MPGQVAFDPRLVERPEADEVGGGDQVNGVAHEVGTHHDPFHQKIFEIVVAEAGQPRPQSDVGRQGGLGLQPGQVPDRVQGGPRGPAEQ